MSFWYTVAVTLWIYQGILLVQSEVVGEMIVLANPRGRQGRAPPLCPIYFIFKQFSAKILLNDKFSPQTRELALPVWEILDPLLDRIKEQLYQITTELSKLLPAWIHPISNVVVMSVCPKGPGLQKDDILYHW